MTVRLWMVLTCCAVMVTSASCSCGPQTLTHCDGCPSGQVCREGACVPGCTTDSDCPSGEICVGEVCLPGGCLSATDCSPGHDAGHPHDGGGIDAGGPIDAGAAQDAGADAGPPADAGHADAGAVDAGVQDAGSCPDSATFIYVIDTDGTFSRFNAGANPSFTDLGKLSCPAQSGLSPYSMSVDRNPVAWVLYGSNDSNNSQLFKVDVPALTCTPTTFQSGQQGFTTFGMGFVANGPNATQDTLYLAASLNALGNGDLGSLDTGSLHVTEHGVMNSSPELTGTGDGRLFGYFPGDSTTDPPWPPAIAEIDKNNGNEGNGWPLGTLSDTCQSDPCTLDYAFAFWGGDFWIFLKRYNDTATSVWRFNPTTQALDDVLDTPNRHIVGAGVSTCAPTQ